jgi:starch synthase
MPSRYEPCGLNQLYSLKYGTVPIVRATGGLSDTIDDIVEETGQGTGFVFEKYKAQELLLTIRRAVDCFKKKRTWRKIIKQGMQKDFSWFNSANKYIELYHTALEKRKI